MNIFQKKDKIQKQALEAWKKHKFWGLLAMCTGSGKTRVGILATQMAISHNTSAKILIVTPTEKLRDVGWSDEFKKWEAYKMYLSNVDTVCYASLNKIEKETYSLVILDEAHNLTEPKLNFFKNNTVKSVMALTATPPSDVEKKDLFRSLNVKTVFKYTLDQGVKDGVVAPFNITVVTVPLDNKIKKYTQGKKTNVYTEKEKYNALEFGIRGLMFRQDKKSKEALKFMFMHRMRFIYGLDSKVNAAKKILKEEFAGERTLIFCANIAQTKLLCKNTYHSQTSDEDYDKFLKKKLLKLAAVKKLNEGENIPDLESILVVQLTSKDKDIIQRIGRAVRWREGHEAKVWILVSEGTQDEQWCQNALKDFDQSKIKYLNFKDL